MFWGLHKILWYEDRMYYYFMNRGTESSVYLPKGKLWNSVYYTPPVCWQPCQGGLKKDYMMLVARLYPWYKPWKKQ